MTSDEWVPQSVMVTFRLTDSEAVCVPNKETLPVDLGHFFHVRTMPGAVFYIAGISIS